MREGHWILSGICREGKCKYVSNCILSRTHFEVRGVHSREHRDTPVFAWPKVGKLCWYENRTRCNKDWPGFFSCLPRLGKLNPRPVKDQTQDSFLKLPNFRWRPGVTCSHVPPMKKSSTRFPSYLVRRLTLRSSLRPSTAIRLSFFHPSTFASADLR
jgi:hypothetical protein